MEIAAPAFKLATQGIYGNDLFAGFYGAEKHYYVFMPMYPIAVALSFKVFGLGVAQARLVSVLSGLATVWLTYRLGKRLFDPAVGHAAAAALCFTRLAIDPHRTGITLLDLSRMIRFDVMVPALVLGACLCFVHGQTTGSRGAMFASGLLVGFATLAHVWGAFVLPLFVGVAIWHNRWRAQAWLQLAALGAGVGLALLPWVLYIAQAPGDFSGQMLRHQGRFDILNPGWYWTNLLHEHWRFARWVGGRFRQPILWPRPGLLAFALAVALANIQLLASLRRARQLASGFLLASVPVLAVLMGLLVNQKRYPYTLLVLPFLGLQAGLGLVTTWRWSAQRKLARALIVVLCASTLLEAGVAVTRTLVAAASVTPYAAVTAAIQRLIPKGSRALISQTYWMGLIDDTTRSVILVHALADSRFHPPGGALSMPQAFRQVRPEYVTLEDRFVGYESPQNPAVEHLWSDFVRSMLSLCPTVVGRIDLPDYEPLTIYRCGDLAP